MIVDIFTRFCDTLYIWDSIFSNVLHFYCFVLLSLKIIVNLFLSVAFKCDALQTTLQYLFQ
jgi:hypothetical protein